MSRANPYPELTLLGDVPRHEPHSACTQLARRDPISDGPNPLGVARGSRSGGW